MPTSGPRHVSVSIADVGASSFKRKPRLLPLLLKAIIMTLITFIFFVFLGLAAILLLHLCLAGGLLHRRRRSSSSNLSPGPSFHESYHDHPLQHQSPHPGLSPSELRRVPEFRFLYYGKILATLGKKREESTVECAICLDEVREGQWCRKLMECGHVFHKGCVDAWLVKVATCPVCRRGVSGQREGGGGGGRGRDLKADGFQGLLRLGLASSLLLG